VLLNFAPEKDRSDEIVIKIAEDGFLNSFIIFKSLGLDFSGIKLAFSIKIFFQ